MKHKLNRYLEPVNKDVYFLHDICYLDALEEKRQEFMSHVRPECAERLKEDYPVTLQEWQDPRANSWERKLLMFKADDTTLLHILAHYWDNSFVYEADTYSIQGTCNEALALEVLPELVRRIKSKNLKEVELL